MEVSDESPTGQRPREGRALTGDTAEWAEHLCSLLCSLPTWGLATAVLSLPHPELPECQALRCARNFQCSAEAPACRCLPPYTQQGSQCQGESVTWRRGLQLTVSRHWGDVLSNQQVQSAIYREEGLSLQAVKGACPQGLDQPAPCSGLPDRSCGGDRLWGAQLTRAFLLCPGSP